MINHNLIIFWALNVAGYWSLAVEEPVLAALSFLSALAMGLYELVRGFR